MNVDRYTRAILTFIAAALGYLCVVLTPMPTASAQTAPRPGDDTGPARCVIVGWNTTDQVPVQVLDSITLKTTGEMRITGAVQTEQRPNSVERVVLAGWEENGEERMPGTLRRLRGDPSTAGRPTGLPVTAVTEK